MLLSSTCAVLGMSGATVARADVTPAGPTASTVTLVGESGSFLRSNASDQWRAGPDRISVDRMRSDGVWVHAARGTSDDTDAFTFDFLPPAGQTLAAEVTYAGAQGDSVVGADYPEIDVSGHSTGCNTESGQFTVLDIAPDLGRLWIVYEDHCDGSAPGVFGEIRYNEPIDSPDEVVSPARIAWPQQWSAGRGRAFRSP